MRKTNSDFQIRYLALANPNVAAAHAQCVLSRVTSG